MAFEDDFSAALATRGIAVDPSVLPDHDTTAQRLADVQNWFFELDADVRDGYDEGTAEYQACHIIADDPDVAVAPELQGLVDAFDQTSGQRLSEMLAASLDALSEVDAG